MNETSTTTSATDYPEDLASETRRERDQRRHRAGMWILGNLLNDTRAAAWCADHGVGVEQRGVLWTGSNPAGGVLVPEELAREIIWHRDSRGAFRANARVVNLTSDNHVAGSDPAAGCNVPAERAGRHFRRRRAIIRVD